MKTLEEYHQTYPARPGDTAEDFAAYEKFCEQNPRPEFVVGKNFYEQFNIYSAWYDRLSAHLGNALK